MRKAVAKSQPMGVLMIRLGVWGMHAETDILSLLIKLPSRNRMFEALAAVFQICSPAEAVLLIRLSKKTPQIKDSSLNHETPNS